ncbi:MAG: hypothetical protein IJM14_09080 [Lachnospiraceae bacterium]|nr:hypothetical protein [Lachnospiraceae bacterium]
MIRIEEITKINKKNIAILDTSSISFMQGLQNKGIKLDSILEDYELILIPGWVLTEIEDAPGRAEFVQKLIDDGYPIHSIAEKTYSELTGYEEGNLYQIVLASVSMLVRVKSYLRRFVERKDPLDMEAYAEWIKKLYDEWPIPGESLTNGRIKKKNAGEISITILGEIVSWYYPETEALTVYSQDSDAYIFHMEAEASLRKLFALRTPVPVSYKSNDCILCQLFRYGEINESDISACRKDERKITFSKEQPDHSVVLVTEMVDNDLFIELIKDEAVHIIF